MCVCVRVHARAVRVFICILVLSCSLMSVVNINLLSDTPSWMASTAVTVVVALVLISLVLWLFSCGT